MVVGRGVRGLIAHLLAVNMVVSLIILGLAGWSLDKYINGEQSHPHLGGNTSTSFMLIFALIGGVISACSVGAGLIHYHAWGSYSLVEASSLALISCANIALTLGLVCKEISLGGHRGKRLQTLEAFIVISFLAQLLYMGFLHAGLFNNSHGPCYGSKDDDQLNQ